MTFVIARGAVWDIKVNPPRLLSALDVLNELEAILEDFPNFSAESALWDPRIRFVFKDAARIHLGLEIEIQYRHQILKIDDLMQISSDYFILNMKMFPIRRSDYLGIAELLSQLGSIPPDGLKIRQILQIEEVCFMADLRILDVGFVDELYANRHFVSDCPELPTTMTPYPYQSIGIEWLHSLQELGRPGAILADVMGLGKTLQAIGFLALNAKKGKENNLVICPGTLLENWKRELERFAPALKVIAHSGPWRAGTAKQIEGHDVVLTSYDTVVQDYAMLKTINWNVIVLDEAQAIKNPAAKRSLKSKALPRSFGLVVTGTPLENRLLDLWSLTQFADPSRFDSQDSFELNYTDSPESAARVHAMIRPILLRRKLDDIEHQLPEKTIINHPLKWPDELNDIYEDTRSAAIAEYRRSGSLVAVSRLRKLATHPILMDIGPRDLTALSPKYTVTISILEELFLNNEKALVFMTYVRMIDLVAEDLESRFENVLVLKMYGRVPMEERSRLIDRFNMHRGPAVMLCNTIVAGAGLNITGANHVIHFNLEWNPAKEDQATFRVYRHGQTLKTFIHRLFYLDTVDEVIDQRIAMKRELADMSVDARLTSEDIRSWLMVSPNGASSA